MNDNLNFGIHFDLEKGLKDAQADWAKVEKEFTNRTIKIKISVPKATTIDNLKEVTKRLKELKIEPVTLETKSAIQSLVRELKSMEKVLIEINRLNNNSKVPIVTAKANKVNASIVQQEALAQERLTQAKIRTEKAQLQLEAAQRKGTATTRAHTSAYSKQAGMLDSLKRSFAAYTGLFAVARIVTKIREITGEFELQRVALGAIIQDKGRADQLFFQIQAKALESPFQIKELITYTKQLAAYRIETEQLFDTTMRLADISAGLGVEMDRLILAYGQVKAASVLRGQELRQFTEAGIPLVQLLAQKFTALNGTLVTTGDVFKLISEKAVSFEMVKEIFEDMTNEGGIFYDMQRIQSKTLAGSWSNLKDAADLAFNDIGQSQYGLMKGTINVTKNILTNWDSVQRGLETLVITYGVYKAAVLAASIQQGVFATTTIASTAAAGTGLNAFIAKAILGFKALGVAIKTNPITFWLSAITAVVGVIWTWVSASNDAKEKQDETTLSIIKERVAVNDLLNALQTTNLTQKERLKIMNKVTGYSAELADKITKETAAMTDNKEILEAIIKIQKEYNKAKEAEFYVQRTSTSSGLDEVVKQFQEAQGNLLDEQSKLENNYSNFWNKWAIISKEGLTSTGLGGTITEEFTSKDKTTIQKILDNKQKGFEKSIELEKWYKKELEKVSSPTATFEQKDRKRLLEYVFEGLNPNNYLTTVKEITKSQKQLDISTRNVANQLKGYFSSIHGDLSKATYETKQEIQDVINKITTIPEVQKKRLIFLIGVETTIEDEEKYMSELEGIQKLVGDAYDKWQKEWDVKHPSVKGISKKKDVLDKFSILPDVNDNLLQVISNTQKSYKETTALLDVEDKLRAVGKASIKEDEYQRLQAKKTLAEVTAEQLNFNVSEKEATANRKAGNKEQKTKLELLKEEIDLVETAYTKYQTLSDSIGDAAAKIKIQQEFGGQLKAFNLVFSDEGFKREYLSFQEKIKKLPASQKISFAAGIKISENELKTFQKDLKDKIALIKVQIDNEQQKIDFFDSIFKSTGDKTKAEQMTSQLFGTIGNLKELVKNQLTSIFEEPMNLSLKILKSQPLTPELQTEIDKINEFKSAFHDATNGVKVDYDTLRELIKLMPPEYQAAAQDWIDSSVNANAKVVQDIMDSLGKYKTFDERRKEIWDKYLADVANMGVDSGFSQADVEARRKLAAQALSDLSAEQFKASEDWQKTFGDLDVLASTTIDRLITNLENLIKTDKNLSPENLKLYKEEIDKLKAQKVKDNPFKAITEGLNEYIAATKKLHEEQAKANPDAKVIEQSIEAQKAAFKKLESGVQTTSAAFSQLQSFVSSINELFGATEDTELGAFMLDLATALGYVASALGVVAAAIAIIDALAAPFLIIAAAIAGIASLGMWISSADTRKANKEIEKQEKILAELERSYKKLQEASEKAFGVEWLKAQEAELENLKAQQISYEKQAQAERDKGKDKDEEKLLEYENNAKDVADRIASYQDNLIKKFTGTDLTSFASDLAKAYLDAYIAIGRQGAITTDELKNQWRSLVKNMVVESFVASAIQGAFQDTFDRITKLYENSKIPTAEEINALTQQGAGVIDILGTTLPQLLEGLDLSGLGDASSELSGLAKGIEGITEQQANVLSATMNTQNFYLFTMMTIMKKWDEDSITQTTTMTNLFTIQNSFLQELPFIRQNTENTVTACNNIAATCNDIKSTLNAVTQISGAKKCVNTIVN